MSTQYYFRISKYKKATVKFPLAFFSDYNYFQYYKEAISAFYPDSKENYDEYHNLAWYLKDETKMSFKVDYFIQESTDDPNLDQTVIETVEYRLVNIYTDFLNDRIIDALYFLEEHIDQTIEKSSVKDYLERKLGNLFSHYQRISLDHTLVRFQQIFLNSLESLILKVVSIYTIYNLKLPNELRTLILTSEPTEHLNDIYGNVPTNIGEKILSDLKDENGSPFFTVIDSGKFVSSFLKFVTDNVDDNTDRINFLNRLEAAYYLIYKVSACLNYNSTKIAGYDIFTFRSKKFSKSMYLKTACDYQTSQHKYKLLIDSFISNLQK